MTDAINDFTTLQAFIAGRLSEEEQRAFEERLASDPAMVSELEQALRFREGLEQLRSRKYLGHPTRRGTWLVTLAVAASAVLALALWVFNDLRTPPLLMASIPPSFGHKGSSRVTAQFTFVATRGQSGPALETPSDGVIELRVEPSSPAPYHRVSLARLNGSSWDVLSRREALTTSGDGYIHCFVDALRLTPGAYALQVEDVISAPGRTQAEFHFSLHAHNANTH